MQRATIRVSIGVLAAAGLLAATSPHLPNRAASRATTASTRVADRARGEFARLPLQFEANTGQTDSRVRFLSRGPGYTMFLGQQEAVVALSPSRPNGVSQVVRLRLSGANPDAPVVGESPLSGTTNHFIGSDASKWRTDVPTYARVRYDDVYDGIDLVYYGNQQQLEYDFVVAPGADPSQIGLAFPGAPDARVDEHGDLVLSAGSDALRMRKAVVYQDADDGRVMIEARYAPRGAIVGFELGEYDRTRPLVIDPVLAYSTYMGGSYDERGFEIAIGPAGSVYISGVTLSTDYPTMNAYQPEGSPADILKTEAFVTRINPAGTAIEYSTYLGGNSRDLAHGLAVGPGGEVYVAGHTASSDFPLKNPLQAYGGGNYIDGGDAFVTKLTAAGNALVYSTCVGGTAQEWAFDLAVDASGSAYVTGWTRSANFPLVSAAQPGFGSSSGTLADAFVFKINPAGTALVYSTYLGGFDLDEGKSIAVDTLGNAFVTGTTNSANFPVQSPAQGIKNAGGRDAFVTKLDPTGTTLVSSTYLGGAGEGTGGTDDGNGIAVDAFGRAYVVGETFAGASFPSIGGDYGPGSTDDAFVARLAADGATFEFLKRLGGSAPDRAQAVAVDAAGGMYIVGATQSTDFPTAAPLQANSGGNNDVFVVRLDTIDAGVKFSTYLGGASPDFAYDLVLDAIGNVYVTGFSLGSDFPTVSPIRQDLNNSYSAVIFKVTMEATAPAVTVTRPNASGERVYAGTPYLIQWTASDDGVLASFDVEVSSNDGGTYAPVPNCSGLPGSARACTWNTPGPATTQGRIRVRARDASGKTTTDASNARFTILAGTAAITVTDPTSAITIVNGTSRLIKWSHNLGAQSWVRVDVSTNGGASWAELAASVKNSSSSAGSFLWDVGLANTIHGRVRVTWLNGPADDSSNADFSVLTPTLSMSRPSAGTNWGWFTHQTVYWSTNLPKTEHVNIRLSENGGASFPHVVATNLVASAGKANVIVPGLAASTDQARLKVEWVGHEAVYGVSSAGFRVAFPFVTVTKPDGPATTWTIGTSPTITWTNNLGSLENVRIDLSLDGGASFPIGLAPSTKSDGTQKFTVPPAWATAQGRVRITWVGTLDAADTSNADFVIK
jgi:hypothetical protein